MFTTAWAADSNWNEGKWKNEKFNQLLKEARVEADQDKRREMYVEMQRIARDEGPSIVYMFTDYVMAANKKVKYENLAGNFWDDGFRAAERWWFES